MSRAGAERGFGGGCGGDGGARRGMLVLGPQLPHVVLCRETLSDAVLVSMRVPVQEAVEVVQHLVEALALLILVSGPAVQILDLRLDRGVEGGISKSGLERRVGRIRGLEEGGRCFECQYTPFE